MANSSSLDDLKRKLSEDTGGDNTSTIGDVEVIADTIPNRPAGEKKPEPEVHEPRPEDYVQDNTDNDEIPTGDKEPEPDPDAGERPPISAETAIILIDFIIPALIFYLYKIGGYHVDKKALKLTASERTLLERPIQRWIETIDMSKLKPWHVATFAIIAVYTGKAVVAPKEKIRERKRKQDVKL